MNMDDTRLFCTEDSFSFPPAFVENDNLPDTSEHCNLVQTYQKEKFGEGAHNHSLSQTEDEKRVNIVTWFKHTRKRSLGKVHTITACLRPKMKSV